MLRDNLSATVKPTCEKLRKMFLVFDWQGTDHLTLEGVEALFPLLSEYQRQEVRKHFGEALEKSAEKTGRPMTFLTFFDVVNIKLDFKAAHICMLKKATK